MLALCKGTGAVEGTAPSLVSWRLGVRRLDVAHLIFASKETFHDMGGLIATPGMDSDLDRDRIALQLMVRFRR